jgi:hypothetical protein
MVPLDVGCREGIGIRESTSVARWTFLDGFGVEGACTARRSRESD